MHGETAGANERHCSLPDRLAPRCMGRCPRPVAPAGQRLDGAGAGDDTPARVLTAGTKKPKGGMNMAARTTPPFRADHVGSLLRPKALLDARAKQQRNEITQDQLKPGEDAAIRDG